MPDFVGVGIQMGGGGLVGPFAEMNAGMSLFAYGGAKGDQGPALRQQAETAVSAKQPYRVAWHESVW